MKEIKEIDKNRKAKFKRLLDEFVNNRIGAREILAKSFIDKNLFSLTEQYLTYAKRDIMSCETKEDIDTRFGVHVKVLLTSTRHIAMSLNASTQYAKDASNQS